MKKGMVQIVITTYNCPQHISGLLRSIEYQSYKNYHVIIADDGSTDDTIRTIKGFMDKLPIQLLDLPHGERGVARFLGIEEALKYNPEFIVFLDADMIMKKNLLLFAVDAMRGDAAIDGLVLQEEPYSDHHNFFTKVKLFERRLLNNSKKIDVTHSIEAARFWRAGSYTKTGGINPEQIAFEEIQPTLRCIDQGGQVEKLFDTGVFHDEKKVTLMNLLEKKSYYFSQMPKTIDGESNGFIKALKRWYLFRPVYYTKQNLVEYVKHPLLFAGMVWMYVALTFIGVYHIGLHYSFSRLKKARQAF